MECWPKLVSAPCISRETYITNGGWALNETLTRQAQKVDFPNPSGAAVRGRTPTRLEVRFGGTLTRLERRFGVIFASEASEKFFRLFFHELKEQKIFLGYFFASVASEKFFWVFFCERSEQKIFLP